MHDQVQWRIFYFVFHSREFVKSRTCNKRQANIFCVQFFSCNFGGKANWKLRFYCWWQSTSCSFTWSNKVFLSRAHSVLYLKLNSWGFLLIIFAQLTVTGAMPIKRNKNYLKILRSCRHSSNRFKFQTRRRRATFSEIMRWKTNRLVDNDERERLPLTT